MTLGEKQRKFTELVGMLIAYAYAMGYELTFGETFRTSEQAELNAKKGIGIKNTLHTKRLAVDFNLFKDGVWLTDSEAYRPLGERWKSLHPLCRWGGDFRGPNGEPRPDGCHFSMEHDGIR